eukprot:g810.t1
MKSLWTAFSNADVHAIRPSMHDIASSGFPRDAHELSIRYMVWRRATLWLGTPCIAIAAVSFGIRAMSDGLAGRQSVMLYVGIGARILGLGAVCEATRQWAHLRLSRMMLRVFAGTSLLVAVAVAAWFPEGKEESSECVEAYVQFASSAPTPDTLCTMKADMWVATVLTAMKESGAYFNSSSLASLIDLQNSASEILEEDRRGVMSMAITLVPTMFGFSYGIISAARTLQATLEYSTLAGMIGSVSCASGVPWMMVGLGAFRHSMADVYSLSGLFCATLALLLAGFPSKAILHPMQREDASRALRWQHMGSFLFLVASSVLFFLWVNVHDDFRAPVVAPAADLLNPISLVWVVLAAMLEFVGTSLAIKVLFCDIFLEILGKSEMRLFPPAMHGIIKAALEKRRQRRPLELPYRIIESRMSFADTLCDLQNHVSATQQYKDAQLGHRVAIGVGREHCLRKFFDMIDDDHSGTLSLDEIQEALSESPTSLCYRSGLSQVFLSRLLESMQEAMQDENYVEWTFEDLKRHSKVSKYVVVDGTVSSAPLEDGGVLTPAALSSTHASPPSAPPLQDSSATTATYL